MGVGVRFLCKIRTEQGVPPPPPPPPDPTVDFGLYRPHWQGYGTDTVGGFGEGGTPTIYIVNTLADNLNTPTNSTRNGIAVKESTLRAACAATGPRIVLFEVSGVIDLRSYGGPIMIEEDYITIAGQTAPGGTGAVPGGINLRGYGFRVFGCKHVVFQHLRLRNGHIAGHYGDATDTNILTDMGCEYVVADHCSLAYTRYMAFSVARDTAPYDVGIDKVSLLDSIVAFGLCNPIGPGQNGNEGMGGNLQGWWFGSSTWARNLFVHNSHRIPAIGAGWRTLLINNLIYGSGPQSEHPFYNPITLWGHGEGGGFAHEDDNPDWALDVAVINNKFVPSTGTGSGILSGSDEQESMFHVHVNDDNVYIRGDSVWLSGNEGPGITGSSGAGQWNAVIFTDPNVWPDAYQGGQVGVEYTAEPSWMVNGSVPGASTAEPFQRYTAGQLPDQILPMVGAWATERDSVDEAAVSMTEAGIAENLINMGARLMGGTEVHPTIAENTHTLELPANPFSVDPDDEFDRYNLQTWLEDLAIEIEGGTPSAGPSITIRDSAYTSSGPGGDGTISVTLSDVVAGDAIVAFAYLNGGGLQPVTFSTNRGDTFGTAIEDDHSDTTQPALSASYVLSAVGGTTIVTAAPNQNFYRGFAAMSIRTTTGSFALDDTCSGQGFGQAATLPALTATTLGIAVAGMTVFEGGAINCHTDWTQREVDTTFTNVTASLIYQRTAAGNYAPEWTTVPNAAWVGVGIALKVIS